ncbi:hypothetical protein CLAFUW4_12593 [Fulvia fulva]|uniref:Uncharacterized protein n=1 Tax=Passalora fulva TaxID=5499 RepID=A0A9Q8USR7_PASFU|nr:uncharacterized protein CLAFUR5_11618 [Fulvia fulva]KAK4617704.1 hypothetical protein CLAFUR4_12598 [Fulvia fulva]KAK4619010.1 hypothetical protein CLAFUR0_12609 [Fulvia fulva]UJO21129.1 hypothetical protein CLAFUR5_11618 [Fulvia fulva]WPV18146.1 hypothetical protein CLAFUW4_12593 [Fulvia fulva]WPV33194.1 hypothetical protein CLAFUW7_12600 [Fulvia fulva]
MMLLETNSSGLMLCNAKAVVLAAAHLYSATKLIQASSEPWEDMDFVVDRENEVAPFVSPGDGSVNNAATQYCLAMGFKVKQLAGKGRVKFPKETKDHLKLTNTSRFVPEGSGITDPHSTRHRHEAATRSTLVHKKGVDLSRLYSALKVYAKTHGMQDPAIAKQRKETRKLSTSQLLTVIQEILLGDDVYLHFNLYHFYTNVLTIMHKVREAYYKHPSSVSKSHDLSIAAIVNEILWDAGQVEKAGRSMGNTMLYQVGEMIDFAAPLRNILYDFIPPQPPLTHHPHLPLPPSKASTQSPTPHPTRPHPTPQPRFPANTHTTKPSTSTTATAPSTSTSTAGQHNSQSDTHCRNRAKRSETLCSDPGTTACIRRGKSAFWVSELAR